MAHLNLWLVLTLETGFSRDGDLASSSMGGVITDPEVCGNVGIGCGGMYEVGKGLLYHLVKSMYFLWRSRMCEASEFLKRSSTLHYKSLRLIFVHNLLRSILEVVMGPDAASNTK